MINLNEYSFLEWVKFVFDHPVADEGKKEWYWDERWEWEADATRILEYSTRLFRNPGFLINEYTREQINQGFWFLLGATGQLSEYIWDKETDWRIREECVRAMADFFRRLFVENPIQESCYMWWDLLLFFTDNPDPKIEEAMLEALSEILVLDSEDCQISALHGLGHLGHEGKKNVIEKYLASHSNLNDETRTYALSAIEGRVQ
jgi:hypothetical protein